MVEFLFKSKFLGFVEAPVGVLSNLSHCRMCLYREEYNDENISLFIIEQSFNYDVYCKALFVQFAHIGVSATGPVGQGPHLSEMIAD